MNWLQLTQVVVAAFAALWGPAAWEYWSRERRIAARIERNTKALAANNIPIVAKTLENDTQRSVLELAAIRANPWPVKDIRILATSIVIFVTVSWGPPLGLLPDSTPWMVGYIALATILVLADGPKVFIARRIRRSRREFIERHSGVGPSSDGDTVERSPDTDLDPDGAQGEAA